MRPYALIGLPAAATVLALTGLTAPAVADTTTFPLVVLDAPEQVTVIEGHTKTVTATVTNAGTGTAKGVVLKFGSTEHPVDPSVGLGLPAGCDAKGCAVGDLGPGAIKKYKFTLTPTAQSGLTSTFDVTVGGADGEPEDGMPVTVVRSKGGVDLEMNPIDDMSLGRGRSADVPIVVRNTGTEAVSGVGVFLLAQTGLEALAAYKNCTDDLGDPDEEGEAILSMVICRFDEKLPAGGTFTVPGATPLRVKVAADAGGPFKYFAAAGAVGLEAGDLSSLAGKSGPTLRLQAVTSAAADDDEDETDDLNEDDNVAAFRVAVGKSSADSAAIGATITGAVGDTKTIKVGVRNLGPTATIPPSPQWVQTVRVTLPTGIEVTKADEACFPGTFDEATTPDGRDYTCLVIAPIAKGAEELFSFTGTIGNGTHKGGSVVVDGGVQDSKSANNKADITVRATGGGEGGGGGLPLTGAPVAGIALGGGVLLAGGVAAFLLARRRRVVTQVD